MRERLEIDRRGKGIHAVKENRTCHRTCSWRGARKYKIKTKRNDSII